MMIEGIRKLLEYSSLEYSDRWLPTDTRLRKLGSELGIEVNSVNDAAMVANTFMDINKELNEYCNVENIFEERLYRELQTGQASVTTTYGVAKSKPQEKQVQRPIGELTYRATVELLHCDVPDIGEFYVVRRRSVTSDGANTIMLRATIGKTSAEYEFGRNTVEVKKSLRAATKGVFKFHKFVSKHSEE